MAKLIIKVTTESGENEYNEEMVIDLEALAKVSNPRQALKTHFMAVARKVIAEVDPSIQI